MVIHRCSCRTSAGSKWSETLKLDKSIVRSRAGQAGVAVRGDEGHPLRVARGELRRGIVETGLRNRLAGSLR